ncbi:uncharacterized protein EV422DRAFT_532348 [Fimicolochytrium jonesii]|uniref:uncharacterized protein n=1 Tax=Fimicolochytrium jonesii TaxID=1396493 RepID=UPI0022FF3185|nr:uncharacterized protein EV422DRAFT_532348 [Fimicolochytrium jonesii]KAI8819811.1 hypothetical protein EV422DRAFT_532348 [Fimicolochytrium jonesii]
MSRRPQEKRASTLSSSTAPTDGFSTPTGTPSEITRRAYFPVVGVHSASASTEGESSTEGHRQRATSTGTEAPLLPSAISEGGGSEAPAPAWQSDYSIVAMPTGSTSELNLLGNTNTNPTLSPGHKSNWRETKEKLHRNFKVNSAGAQVAFTIVLVALFTLINPLQDAAPTNTLYLPIAAIVVASPNQTISVRLYTQRLIGVFVAGCAALAVLGLDAVIPPKSCIDCAWKPYAVGIILFAFIYGSVSIRESVPGQAYTSKLTDLTFIITLLGAYDDLKKNPDSARYAPPLGRMASMVFGLLLTMFGASVFWPVRVNLVHRITAGNLFKDMASYFKDLVEQGYVRELPEMLTLYTRPRMYSKRTDTTESIAVAGGMDVIGSEEAAAAPRLKVRENGTPRFTKGSSMAWLLGRPEPHDVEHGNQDVEEINTDAPEETKSPWERALDDVLKDDDHDPNDIVLQFHQKTHPIAVGIIRTLEKERARLEASYQVEVRLHQKPHFVPVAPLTQVIRRLRLLFYQLSGLYSDRLITLRALSPRFLDSSYITENTALSEWVAVWMQDATSMIKLMHARSQQAEGGTAFSMQKYSLSLCNALTDIGEIVLLTTVQGARVIGSAELAARLAVTVNELVARRHFLEAELLAMRKQLIDGPPLVFPRLRDETHEQPELGAGPSATSARPQFQSQPSEGHGSRVFGHQQPSSSRAFPPAPELGNVAAAQAENQAILAFQYSTYIHVWEITEVVLSSARAVGKLIKVYS